MRNTPGAAGSDTARRLPQYTTIHHAAQPKIHGAVQWPKVNEVKPHKPPKSEEL